MSFVRALRTPLFTSALCKSANRAPIYSFARKMSSINYISTDKAAGALGHYSQAIRTGNQVYLSGQLGIKPGSKELVSDDITEQTEQALENLKAVLEASGSSIENVVKTTVFLSDINDFVKMNTVYEQKFGSHKPARSAFEVANLPKAAKVEIECIANAINTQ
ncbi:hypothetical protein H4219_003163 [Mycoemilia scoparia]|uniref:Uncharacterized protein n=1 Tax=Mycoemilia scoparia TaxID=417184 RepID=A0A9W8DT30_9FUNG|nr:hypothetical protein H4219_003163 [Mycoemilia scoparia]